MERRKKNKGRLYRESRKGLKEFLKRKRKEKHEEEEAELRNIKKDSEIWKYINKKKKRKEWTENNIEEWRIYFMKLLGRREENEKEISCAKTEMQGENEEKELGEEEIGEAVMKMKHKKAGIDGIPAETWRFGGKAIKKELTEVLRDVWKEGCTPEEWKTSIIVPLHKRRSR